MFKLDSDNSLIFSAKDLKEVYEPIVKQFGFEYEPYLDKHKKGLVWTKLYEDENTCVDLWPTMVIRETGMDPIPNLEEAPFFSTSLWWEGGSTIHLMIYVNPDEFGTGSDDEVEELFNITKAAQKEVNDVLEQCRLLLVGKLTEIKSKLIIELEENE